MVLITKVKFLWTKDTLFVDVFKSGNVAGYVFESDSFGDVCHYIVGYLCTHKQTRVVRITFVDKHERKSYKNWLAGNMLDSVLNAYKHGERGTFYSIQK